MPTATQAKFITTTTAGLAPTRLIDHATSHVHENMITTNTAKKHL